MGTDRRIRVLFVVPNLDVGGAERHVTDVAPALDGERFAPMICCIKERGRLFDRVSDAGVAAVSLDLTNRQAGAALVQLIDLMRRFRPHVVITRGFNAEMLGRVAARVTRVPVAVVWKHNCGDVSRRRRERVLDRVMDRVTDYYFGVAYGQVTYLVDGLGFRGDKIRIIRNGVDPARFAPVEGERREETLRSLGIGPDERVIGILAALRPEKDHATFLRAGREVLRDVPNARLLVVGDGPMQRELEALASDLGIRARVTFAGMRTDVAEVLSVTEVIVLSSYTVECCPFALLEAMAAGVPAVCTAIGGLPEMIEHGETGYLVSPRDPRGLADGILRVIGTPARSREMGDAARRRLLDHFTLRRSVEEFEHVLTSIVGPARGG